MSKQLLILSLVISLQPDLALAEQPTERVQDRPRVQTQSPYADVEFSPSRLKDTDEIAIHIISAHRGAATDGPIGDPEFRIKFAISGADNILINEVLGYSKKIAVSDSVSQPVAVDQTVYISGRQIREAIENAPGDSGYYLSLSLFEHDLVGGWMLNDQLAYTRVALDSLDQNGTEVIIADDYDHFMTGAPNTFASVRLNIRVHRY